MITSRGWWFLILVLCLLTAGVFGDQSFRAGSTARETVILLMLTLLFWFLAEWLLFALRVNVAVPALRLRRELRDARGPVDTLWAGRSFQVHLELLLPHWSSLPYLKLTDYVPPTIEPGEGETERDGALSVEHGLAIRYTIRCVAAGRVRFEGVGIQLADFQGFFHYATFLPDVVEYHVLPPLADAEGHRPTVKRHNLLPAPGLHRHLRPGSGSELLDLRDYIPGDPPKTIAWKVSARRDRLITKEFESEVPVRCTLFVDTAHSVRVGPLGKNALARLVEISAAVAQANAGVRDLTGLCLFDEQAVARYLRPNRGSRSLVQLINILADAAGLAPATGEARVATLLPLAFRFAQEVYPYLLRPDLNRIPTWSTWIWPVPTYTDRSPGRTRRLFFGLFLLLASLPLVGTGLTIFLFNDFLATFTAVFVPLPEILAALIGTVLTVWLVLRYYSGFRLVHRALGLGLSPRKRRQAQWRKRLAAILAERYRLTPGGIGFFLEDDEQLSLYLQRFLAEHQVPYPLPFYDQRGRYLFASPGKIGVLAQALVRAVGKGHDNELFVLLVDLLELVEQLEPLLSAVKMTLARHHMVLVICPWPPGVPTPPARTSTKSQASDGMIAEMGQPIWSAGHGVHHSSLRVSALVKQATTDRFHRAFEQLRRTFHRLGVPVICAASADPVRLILERMDRLRALGVGGRR
jgi:uncharacterized protein (DUF58 family)